MSQETLEQIGHVAAALLILLCLTGVVVFGYHSFRFAVEYHQVWGFIPSSKGAYHGTQTQ
jgi:hypothetical protein